MKGIVIAAGIVLVVWIFAIPFLILQSLRGPPTEHLFDYAVETSVDLDFEGTIFNWTGVAACEVVETGGGFVDNGSNPRRLEARRTAGDNPFFLLPGGSAVVLHQLNSFCPWTELKLAALTDRVPVEVDGGRRPEGANDQTVLIGKLAWLDSITSPVVIRLGDIGKLRASSLGPFSNLRVRQSLTTAPPTELMVDTLPIIRAVQSDAAVRKQMTDEQRRSTPLLSSVVDFNARMFEHGETVCKVEQRPGPLDSAWMLLEPFDQCRGAGRGAPVQMALPEGPARIELRLTDTADDFDVALTVAGLIAAGATPHPPADKNSWLSHSWTETICIDADCVEIPFATDKAIYFNLYHPSTGRLIKFSPASSWQMGLIALLD